MTAPFGLRVKLLASTRLFLSIALASVSTIWAVFLLEMFGTESKAGLIAGTINIGTLILGLALIKFLEGNQSKIIMTISLSAFSLAYIIFGISNKWILFIIGIIILIFAEAMRKHAFGELTMHQGDNKQLFFLEGVMYVLSNVGWFLGPLVASLFLQSKIHAIFILSGILMMIATIIMKESPLIDAKGKKQEQKIMSTIKEFFKNKQLKKVFLYNTGLNMWWPVITFFMPLYVINQGLPKSIIGITLFASMIPIIFIELLVSKTGQRLGEKFFFKLGFGILFLSGILIYFIKNPIWVLSILVVSGVGAGFIEPTQETHFFKKVPKKSEKRLFSIFLSSADLGLLLGKIIGAGIIAILPFKTVFLTIGIFMGALFFLVHKE